MSTIDYDSADLAELRARLSRCTDDALVVNARVYRDLARTSRGMAAHVDGIAAELHSTDAQWWDARADLVDEILAERAGR